MRAMYYKSWRGRGPEDATIQFILPDEIDLIDELARYGIDYSLISTGRYVFPEGTVSQGILALRRHFEETFEEPDEAMIIIPFSVYASIIGELLEAGGWYLAPENEPPFECIAQRIQDRYEEEPEGEPEEEEVLTVEEYIRRKRAKEAAENVQG